MKLLIATLSVLALISCGKNSKNSKKNKKRPEIKISEELTAEQIAKRCGNGPTAFSIFGEWTSDLDDEIYPKMLIDFEFHPDQKVEIGISCKINDNGVSADYNYKMVQTSYELIGDTITFLSHNPIVFSLEEDGVDCQLKDISGDYKLGSQGECMTIQLKNQKIFLVKE